jgi:hypothetical protein
VPKNLVFASNPVAFFRAVTGLPPTDYQEQILLDKNTHITIRAGRQTGKTEVIAAKVLWNCITNPVSFKVLIIAPTARQSNIVYSKIETYLARNNDLRKFILHHTQDYTNFDNGSEIYCLPGDNPDTVRGYSPNMIVIDEAAFVKDKVYEAIEPSLAVTNGTLVLISSPFGKQGRFYDSHARIEYYSKYHVPWSKCPFVNRAFIEKEKSSKTELEFRQEYEAEFIEEVDTFFSHELIKKSIIAINKKLLKEKGWDYYLGVDPARYGMDECVYFVVRSNGEKIEVVYWEATGHKPGTEVEGRIKNLNEVFDFTSIFVEENGLGGPICDSLEEAGLPMKPFTTSLESKSVAYCSFKRMLEQGEIQIPDEPKLVWQMSELQYKVSSNGHFSLHHPDKPNAHDDWIDALVFACMFKQNIPFKFAFA